MIAEIFISEPLYLTKIRIIEIEINTQFDTLRVHNLIKKFKREGRLIKLTLQHNGEYYVVHKNDTNDLINTVNFISKMH